MISLLPTFLFLSPIFGYAIFLLVDDRSDPIGLFHERYRVQEIRKTSQINLAISPESPNQNWNALSQLGKLSHSKIAGMVIFSLIVLAFSPSFLSLTCIAIAVLLVLLNEKRREVKAREVRSSKIAQELPAVTEIFAILISSGESMSSALEILSRNVEGEISLVLSEAVGLLRQGLSLTAVLDNISQKSGVPQLRRFCDSLIVAAERGTGLSEVLARQIDEIRSKEHAQKLERAGRAEIVLMIPVVFLILPISVLFALWPSYVALGLTSTF